MVLEDDMPSPFFGKLRDILVFAFGQELIEGRRVQVEFQDLDPVSLTF